ncbi:MobF family relaxase [Nocardia noduli]|uniref:MobF family relaxase n=1 Tax=Nocardia noduli TaxID=2815722 RepID=UPI001C212BCB|nr:MobF family relaxase [Nocardia noduli]
MGGNLHKLSAGDGYTYLTKQVAAMDSSERGTATLSDYYSMKGEAPGRWMGSGLTGLAGVEAGDVVTEAQMKALYGLGRHPEADAIEAIKINELAPIHFRRNLARGMTPRTAAARAAERAAEDALEHSRLGSPFKVYSQASQFRQAVAAAFSDHNVARGLAWNTPVPDEVRAKIRTDLGRSMFSDEYGRPPLDERELSSWIARNSRQTTQACAGYDFTLFPKHKSISALWALADKQTSAVVEQAHLDAAAYTIEFLENNAVFTRTGANGVAQVDVTGVIATLFTHRDSRAGDPYLHSHIAISNKVQTLDGRWLALDGRTLYKFAVWASEVYNTRIETLLRQRLGVRFVEHPHTDPNKRGTRAVAGISESLCALWSSRDAAIQARRAELVRDFQRTYGREPSPREAYDLAARAATDTRQAKHEPRTHADQRATWHAEAVAHVGSRQAVADMITAALHPDMPEQDVRLSSSQWQAWVEVTADAVVDRVSRDRATWQINHIGAEAQRMVCAANLAPEMVEDMVARVIAATLDPARSVALELPDRFEEPAALRRRDGTAVYVTAGAQSFTSTPILEAEARILDAAARRDGRRASEVGVGIALLEYEANHPDKPLNPGQVALIRDFATSGARVQLALAAAGTGKTTAMRVFTAAWCGEGGTVIGLAPTANAAAVLREEIGVTCDTIDKLIDSVRYAEFAAAAGIEARIPDWVTGIGEGSVVVIDEAALASTAQLDQVIDYVLGRGGSVRMICDDKQLAAISAGGIVRAIADTHGASSLDHVIRFRDEHNNPRHDEAAASLALREGDPAAIGFYLDHSRVHAGDATTIADAAYTAWADDCAAGLDAVMMAPTHAITRELNTRARADRLTAHGHTGPETRLRDDTFASAGDVIRTTKNARRLTVSATDWVRNGTRWRVDHVHPDGALTVTALHTGLRAQLPADYVATEVILGYAATIMTSQGITADTSHTVLTGFETRNDLYMALTRGARDNHVYFPTALSGDEHTLVSDAAMNPATAVDMFTRILARDGSQQSATTTAHQLHDPTRRLAPATDAYVHAVGAAAENLLHPGELTRIDTEAENLHPGLTDQPAWATLRGHLAAIAITGADAVSELRLAYHAREIDTADDVAAVLDWRLDSSGDHSLGQGSLPWLTGIPQPLHEHPVYGPYLSARADLISDLADQIRTTTGEWTTQSAPLWARALISPDTALLGDLAVWRAATAVPDTDRRPTGPPRFAIRERRYQTRLTREISALLGSPHRAAARWAPLAQRIEPRLTEDPYWPVLAEHLTRAARTGTDIDTLVHTVAAERPLPDEHPAAALWWRLARTLIPLHLEHAEVFRPTWLSDLERLLGPEQVAAILDDPGWAGLLAAVEDAGNRWLPADLFDLAVETLRDRADEDLLPASELVTALTARIATLSNTPAPSDPDHAGLTTAQPPPDLEQLPPDPADQPAPAMRSLFDGEQVTTSEVVDEDYLSALASQEPPADPVEVQDTPPPVLVGVLDVAPLSDWDLTTPATPTPLPYAELSARQRVTRLRSDLDTARRRAHELWSAHLAGQGHHRRAAAPMLHGLRRSADSQNRARVAAAEAHHQWTLAEETATGIENEHASAQHEAATVHADGDELAALTLDLHASLLGMEADSARAAADTAKALAEEKEHAWRDVATAQASVPVSLEHLDLAHQTAEGLDLDAVLAARAEVERLEGQLLRAEHTANRTTDDTTTVTDDTVDEPREDQPLLTPPRVPVATLPRPDTTARQRQRSSSAEVAERLRGNRLQMLSTTRLAHEIASVGEQLRRTRAQPAYTTLTPTAVADQTRATHARLHAQADAITTARTDHTTVETLDRDVARARTELATLTHRRDTQHPRGRARRQLDTDITTAQTHLAELTTRHGQAEEQATRTRAAAIALGALPDRWDHILTRTSDPDTLARELTAAIAEDTQRNQNHRQQQRQTEQRITELTTALNAAIAEQQRRDELDEHTRAEEERLRAEEATPESTPVGPVTGSRATRSSGRRRDRRPTHDPTKRRRGPSM